MSIFADFALGKRRPDETSQERMVNDAIDRGLKGYFAGQLINEVTDKALPKIPVIGKLFRDENRELDIKKKQLEIMSAARQLGLKPGEVLDDDVLDMENRGHAPMPSPSYGGTAKSAFFDSTKAINAAKKGNTISLLGVEIGTKPYSFLDDILSGAKKAGKVSSENSISKLGVRALTKR